MYDPVTWMFGVGVVLALLVAYGLGANDVANTFCPSVAAKALTMRQALLVAAVFELSGAVLMGGGVADTIRSGITNINYFTGRPDILAYGMLCALAGTGVWMMAATYMELPVSSTQSIVASIAGMAIVAEGWNAVVWSASTSSFPYLRGMSAIVLSWVFSPVLAAACSLLLFWGIRTAVLRSASAFQRSLVVLPVFVLVTFFTLSWFTIVKAGPAYGWHNLPDGTKAWISAVVAAGATLVAGLVGIPLLKRNVARDVAGAEAAAQAAAAGAIDIKCVDTPAAGSCAVVVAGGASATPSATGITTTTDSEVPTSKPSTWRTVRSAIQGSAIWRALNYGMNYDLQNVIDQDEKLSAMHAAAETFDSKAELSFKYLQVCTACVNSFAHGSNEVANAIGPLAAIYMVWQEGQVVAKNPVPVWLLVIGGLGICAGLATFGYTVMRSLGVKMTKLSNSRGFCVELSVAAVVILASRFNIPLSSTPATVGAIAGVGLLEGRSGFNARIFLKFVLGWVVTVIAAVFLTCVFMLQGLYAPSKSCSPAAPVKP